jgi:pimeloyl-ACP methyl ester carboxylesterase
MGRMATAHSNGLELEYDVLGDPGDPPAVLIMGLGAQLIDWPQEFCALLADRGYRVIRFDNRDAGLSSGLDELGIPDIAAIIGGDLSSMAYGLSDMAADVAGVLDALEIDRAHIAGCSLGGMVAQQFAIEFPDRVRSLTSIMSMTGDRTVGLPTPEAAAVLGRPPAPTREIAIANAVMSSRIIGSPAFPLTDEELLRRATAKVDRAYRPAGTARQYAAALGSPDRTPDLHGVKVPAVVIHGAEDPLINVSGGQATAAAIPGAELVVIPGMGHDLPREAWQQIVDAIDRTARRG